MYINTHSNLNLYPAFYLKAYLCHTAPFEKRSDGSCVASLFLGNNRQHMPVCAKIMSSWVRNIECIAKAHMSLGTLLGCCGICSTGSWSFPGVHPAGR